ncbi:MAG TPA: TonB-dependent receptor [Vicinamibacterales bacterium]|nr:TonB-dependent receptor [Vicinamibacterales bacterium]
MIALLRIPVLVALCAGLSAAPALAQQRGTISGRVLDQGKLALPGATVTIVNDDTGFTRTAVTSETGAFTIPNLEPGSYTVTIEMQGFRPVKRAKVQLVAGSELEVPVEMQVGGLEETVEVLGDSPLIERTSNTVGGSLSNREIEEVPSNFRNVTALTSLIPGMTPNPAQSSFEGGQVVANGTPAQSNVYLIDGMYNNDDRLGGSQGTQVRVVLDNIDEYQVLANQYSAEYGGGAGAIINMVTRGGTNQFHGRAYTYFRDDAFNARGHFLPDDAEKPDERTLQFGFGIGGPIVRDKAHFYFTYERDHEDIAGLKRFPAEAAPLATDFVGTFSVRATNYFGRGDVQLNEGHILNARWVLETAPTKGEGFNVSDETIDAQGWENDWDHLFNITYTAVLTDRASNVLRVGRIGEQLETGAQTFFDSDVNGIGFDGRDPFTIGQSNVHPSYVTGIGGTGTFTTIRTYTIDNSFSYFVPNLLGGEHTFKAGGGFSLNQANPRSSMDSGTFEFESELPFDPANPETYPIQFDITVGPPGQQFDVVAKDRRTYLFVEDKWRVSNNLTFNVGLRYDNQRHAPNSKDDISPRAGFAWDLTGEGTSVVRGGIGRFYSYFPVSVDLFYTQTGVITPFPGISIRDPNSPVLQPDMITDSLGNPGVAVLSAAGRAALTAQRDAILAGQTFNRNPRLDHPDRQMPYQWAWSLGFSHELFPNGAVSIDYVGNVSRDQMGWVDINEPVNGVRPQADGFDPTGTLIPAEARGTSFQRVLQSQTSDDFDGDYQSLQFSFVKRYADRWSGRVSYTLQKSNYVGLGNPDNRRVWLDNDIRADYGRFASDRRHVLSATASVSPWTHLTIATVVSAISGDAINETVGRDVNGDLDNTDRPIQGVDDLAFPIRSEVDSQGRAVINGLTGEKSLTTDLSFRYQIPLARGLQSLDLFYDIFNLFNNENLVDPTGNRRSANFMVPIAARFARQMQFGVRVRF